MSDSSLAQRYVNMLIATNKDPDLRQAALMEFVPYVVDLFHDDNFFLVTLNDSSTAFGLGQELMYVEDVEEFATYLGYLKEKSPTQHANVMSHLEGVVNG